MCHGEVPPSYPRPATSSIELPAQLAGHTLIQDRQARAGGDQPQPRDTWEVRAEFRQRRFLPSPASVDDEQSGDGGGNGDPHPGHD